MEKLMDGKPRELKLGESFKKDGSMAFHSIRYDFQPASVDVTKMAAVEIQESNSVTVTVPHVEGSGTLNTVYKGNKRPVQKECVLIFDHNTGQLSLEKLSNTIQLKKTRLEGSSRASQSTRPVTPSEQVVKVKENKGSPVKKKSHSSSSQQQQAQVPAPAPAPKKDRPSPPSMPLMDTVPEPASEPASSPVEMMTDSSSDSDSGSDSEDEDKSPPAAPTIPGTAGYASLRDDLKLSESGSDSDD